MSREVLTKKLKSMGVVVCGTSEDFGTSKGGIWVSTESGHLGEFDKSSASGIDKFHESGVNKLIEKEGYFLEDYDSGTAIIWKN